MIKYRRLIIFSLLFLTAALVRLYHYPDRLVFGPEQAIFAQTSVDYLEKPSLLGHLYFRTTSAGHHLFHGAQFDYLMLPLIILSRYDPFYFTFFFVFLNLFTGLCLYLVVRRLIGFQPALLAAAIFLFDPFMISHSLYLWDINFFPLIGILSFYLYYLFRYGNRLIYALLLGIISGIGVGMDFAFGLPGLFLFALVVYSSRRRIITAVTFVLGTIIGNLPMVLFDLRHSFYHLRTLVTYLWETATSPGQSQLTYFHFLYLWPLFALFISWLLFRLFRRRLWPLLPLFLLYFFASLKSPLVNLFAAVGAPSGITLSLQKQITAHIAATAPDNFNIAALFDFDTRANPYRYLLSNFYHHPPLPVDRYRDPEALFVIAPLDSDLDKANNYELNSYRPFTIKDRRIFSAKIVVYHLTK